MDNRAVRKQPPRSEMMFWRLTGLQNVVLTEGLAWKKHSVAVRGVLHNNIPIDKFSSLTNELFSILGEGGEVCWSDLTHRLALDVVGSAILGHDFRALSDLPDPIVARYRAVMCAVARPLYVGFPILERLVPRNRLRKDIDELREDLRQLLEIKKRDPGQDFVSHILSQPQLTDDEYLDNIVTMFMAGHVS